MTENTDDLKIDENWIPLMDYAIKKGISLSTLRRHIKANKLTHKVENGRYLLWDDGKNHEAMTSSRSTSDHLPNFHPKAPSKAPLVQTTSQGTHSVNRMALLEEQVYQMTRELQKAHEEIAELKTLIALYEEKIPPQRLDN